MTSAVGTDSLSTPVVVLVTKSDICRRTRRSKILDRVGRMDIGRRSLLDVIFSAFGIAQIRTIFQGDGNSCFDMQLFMI